MAIEQGEDGDRDLYNSLFQCLEAPVRRRILFGLLEHNRQEALMVPEDVHVGENELSELDLALTHRHLPLLEESGLIRWDRDSNEILKGPEFGRVRDLLESINEHDPIIREK